jgi:hypothetical protein
MQISILQNTSLAEGIRRQYEAEADRYRLVQQIEQPKRSSLFQSIPTILGLTTPVNKG